MRLIDRIKERGQEKLLAQEQLLMDVTEELIHEMEKKDISRADLARLLEKPKSFITRLLNGDHNMTLRTLSDVCFALELTPRVVIDGAYHDEIEKQWETIEPKMNGIQDEVNHLNHRMHFVERQFRARNDRAEADGWKDYPEQVVEAAV